MKATLANIYRIYLEPQEVFNEIKSSFNRMYVIMPLVALILLGIISAVLLGELIAEIQYNAVVERLEGQDIPEDVRTEQLARIEQRLFEPTPVQSVIGYTLSAVSNVIKVALMALAVLLLGNMVFGGTARYGMIFSATAYVYMINILEMAVKIPLMLNKWSMEVYTGLGVLGIGEPGTFLHNVFAGFDLFGLWRIVLLSIGMAVIYEKKPKPFLIALLVLWLILILIGSGLATLGGSQ